MQFFRRWWGRAKTPVLGVDISTTAVRVIELANGDRQVQIARYGQRNLPAGAIRDGGVVMRDVICDALRDALHDSGSRLRLAALALPAAAVMKKTLSLPAQSSEDELEMQVEAEAMALLPVARDEIGLDFAIIGPNVQQPDSVDVLLVAARQETINERAELALAVGLKPHIVDLESQALMAAVGAMLRLNDTQAGYLLGVIHIDAEQGCIYFVQGDSILFERQLNSNVVRRESNTSEAIAQEFNRALQLLHTASSTVSLHHVYLLGAFPADLPQHLAKKMSVGVSALNPWEQFAIGSAAVSSPTEHPSACTLACGLAMRSFDP